MTSSTERTEMQLLNEIIEQLEDDGWQVLRDLRSPQVPPQLWNMPVDFVAVREPDILVGEVLSRRIAPSRRVEAVAEVVKMIPNAEFEVYWIGDKDAQEPNLRQIRRYIRESRAIEAMSPQASLLMAIAAFEAAITSYAASIDVEVAGTPRRLLEQLFSLGLVSAPDHSLVVQMYKLRSGIVHAASAKLPDHTEIRAVRGLADRMATGKYVSVDVMADWLRDYLLDAGESVPARTDEPITRKRVDELSRLVRGEFPSASADERRQAVHNLGYAASMTGR